MCNRFSKPLTDCHIQGAVQGNVFGNSCPFVGLAVEG